MSKNIVTKEYVGDVTLPYKKNRGYLFVMMKVGSGTIELGDGGGTIPLAEGSYYEPLQTPISKVTIVTTGTVVVAEG